MTAKKKSKQVTKKARNCSAGSVTRKERRFLDAYGVKGKGKITFNYPREEINFRSLGDLGKW